MRPEKIELFLDMEQKVNCSKSHTQNLSPKFCENLGLDPYPFVLF